MNKRTEIFDKARNYAFFLLKFRLRSENELIQRLKLKKIPEETIKEVVSFLKEKKFIDDNIFAKAWISSRLRKPLGLKRIRQELRQKGIDREIIEAQSSGVRDYSETDTVLDLAKRRLSLLKGTDQVIAKRRVYAFLLRRGFSPEIVINTLNQLCR